MLIAQGVKTIRFSTDFSTTYSSSYCKHLKLIIQHSPIQKRTPQICRIQPHLVINHKQVNHDKSYITELAYQAKYLLT